MIGKEKIRFNKLKNKLWTGAKSALKSLFSPFFYDKKSAQLFQCDLRGLIVNDVAEIQITLEVALFPERIKFYCFCYLTDSGRSSTSSGSAKSVTIVNNVERSKGQLFLRQAT